MGGFWGLVAGIEVRTLLGGVVDPLLGFRKRLQRGSWLAFRPLLEVRGVDVVRIKYTPSIRLDDRQRLRGLEGEGEKRRTRAQTTSH